MDNNELWLQSVSLTNRIFTLTSALGLPQGDHWFALATVSLVQANERLDAIRTLLRQNQYESSVILTRSLFEIAVNLTFINNDREARLAKYLRNGGVPLSREDLLQLQRAQAQGTDHIEGVVPERAWESMNSMCRELGWGQEYALFYRYASVPTHAGSFTFLHNYSRLLAGRPPTIFEKVTVMATAISYHLRVALVAAATFPQQLDITRIHELQNECGKIGDCLSQSSHKDR